MGVLKLPLLEGLMLPGAFNPDDPHPPSRIPSLMHLCIVRHRINITCDDSVLTHIFYEVQWASRCAMLLGEILVLYWTLKRTQLKYTTFKFANVESSGSPY